MKSTVLELESKFNTFTFVKELTNFIGYKDFKDYCDKVVFLGDGVEWLQEIVDDRMKTFIEAVKQGEDAVIKIMTPEGKKLVKKGNKFVLKTI